MKESGKARRRQSREERLRAALRENLRRRKAQARGRGRLEKSEALPMEPGGDDAPIKGKS
jgi:hypothetical protein